jgi:hypothetical protein
MKKYINGQAAKNGDRVIELSKGIAGTIHSINEKESTSNARITQTVAHGLRSNDTKRDPIVTVADCLPIDAIKYDTVKAQEPAPQAEPAPDAEAPKKKK